MRVGLFWLPEWPTPKQRYVKMLITYLRKVLDEVVFIACTKGSLNNNIATSFQHAMFDSWLFIL